jgi:DNA-3-methyladenine glycosylase II
LAGQASLVLSPLPPFRLDLTVWVLRRRPDNLVDRWDGKTYRRVLTVDRRELLEIAISQSGPARSPQLDVVLSCEAPESEAQERVASTVRRLLGIGLDLGHFYRFAHSDERLKPFVDQFQGFKPPRFETDFEALVNAIACQQVTLTLGIRLLNSLVAAYGEPLQTEGGIFHAFPRPQALADANIEDLRKMGFSYQKARYLTGLAQQVISGQFNLPEIELLDDAEAVERLRTLKGVGRWTAEYFLLRGLGRTHVFPADDVGARNHLQRWLGLPALNYREVHAALGRWDEFGGLVYFHLLLKSLVENGIIAV